jgi:hypothetical protein
MIVVFVLMVIRIGNWFYVIKLRYFSTLSNIGVDPYFSIGIKIWFTLFELIFQCVLISLVRLLYVNRTVAFLYNPYGSSPNHFNGIYHRPNGRILLASYVACPLIDTFPSIERFDKSHQVFPQPIFLNSHLILCALFILLTFVKVFLTLV